MEEVKEVIALGSLVTYDVIVTSLWRHPSKAVNEAVSLTTFIDVMIACKEAAKIQCDQNQHENTKNAYANQCNDPP